MDIFIGVTAIANNMILVTYNKHKYIEAGIVKNVDFLIFVMGVAYMMDLLVVEILKLKLFCVVLIKRFLLISKSD